MVQRMATTSKIPIAPGLLKEEQFTFQWKIQAITKRHDIPKDLVLNFDKTLSLLETLIASFMVLSLFQSREREKRHR